jgi:hypothetical protein
MLANDDCGGRYGQGEKLKDSEWGGWMQLMLYLNENSK